MKNMIWSCKVFSQILGLIIFYSTCQIYSVNWISQFYSLPILVSSSLFTAPTTSLGYKNLPGTYNLTNIYSQEYHGGGNKIRDRVEGLQKFSVSFFWSWVCGHVLIFKAVLSVYRDPVSIHMPTIYNRFSWRILFTLKLYLFFLF